MDPPIEQMSEKDLAIVKQYSLWPCNLRFYNVWKITEWKYPNQPCNNVGDITEAGAFIY